MGLRKLTQWEETVAKQEQKRFWLMNIAIVCVIAMCAVLWLVQDKLYGDVVRTGAAAYGCSFIGVAIGLFVRSTTRGNMGNVIGKTEEIRDGSYWYFHCSGNWWSNLFGGISTGGGTAFVCLHSDFLDSQKTESGLR